MRWVGKGEGLQKAAVARRIVSPFPFPCARVAVDR